MNSLVTGATGLVGNALLSRLDHPAVLSRDPNRASAKLNRQDARVFGWNPRDEPAPTGSFAGVDTVFHLAGEPVAEGRWTTAKKERIRESRVQGTRNLVEGIAAAKTRPRVLVSASAVGIYGSQGDRVLDEQSPIVDDFLGEVCQAWECEALQAETLGVRVVCMRIGIVLGKRGGALKKMLPLFRLGVAGTLGNGRQYMPWIHVDDLARLFVFAAEHEALRGPVNGTAPHPVTNRDFTKSLGQLLHRPTMLPAPSFGLRAAFGEFAAVLLASQRVIPRVAMGAGFAFDHGDLEDALRDILAIPAVEECVS